MALSLKHTFQSAKGDGTDPTIVQPSNWNAEHTITCAADVILGRATTPGAVQEVPCTAFGRSLVAAADAAAARTLLSPWLSSFPSGTAMLFAQASAPIGWTKSTTHDDKALRVVSGASGGSAGGSTAFSSVFTSRTISVANMPAHSHGVNDPGHSHLAGSSQYFYSAGLTSTPNYIPTNYPGASGNVSTSSSATGISIQNTGSGTPMDFAVQYVDTIICTKD